MEIELKPCPFCGREDVEMIFCEDGCCGGKPREVACECGCWLESPEAFVNEEQMAKAWNTRTLA